MSVVTFNSLSGALQELVDARLDTIDRMLLGRVPRADRMAIARDVESQIHELIQEREAEGDELRREDVLAALARLDPPEAYLPEPDDEVFSRPEVRVVPSPRLVMPRSRPRGAEPDPRIGRASGIVGMVALALFAFVPLSYLFALLLESEAAMFVGIFGSGLLMFLGGVTAVVLAIVARLASTWSILGLIFGLMAVVLSLLPSGFVLLMLLNA